MRRLAAVANQLNAQPTAAAAPRKGLLQDEVAIITGSGQGIGEAAAKAFAAEGAKVVVSDLDATKSEKVAEEIRKAGGEAISVAGDVTDPAFPDRIVKATIEKFGYLNHIVNNAGYTWDGVIQKITDKQWDAMLAVHNTAPFRLIRAAAPYMREAAKDEMKTGKPRNRSITNVSSTSGLHGNAGQANYATAKSGILGLTKTVAKEWGPFGIRANDIAFGFIQTRLTQAKEKGAFIEVDGKKVPLGIPAGTADENSAQAKAREKMLKATIPLGRPGNATEAASALVFLSSSLASYVSGHCLECTGGAGI